jgi:hypothetical protein
MGHLSSQYRLEADTMKNPTDVELNLEGKGRNTLIDYTYRDASNNKVHDCVILDGRLTEHQIEKMLASLFENEKFIPGQVGLQDLQDKFEAGREWDDEEDHVWHELVAIQYIDREPTGPKADEVVAAWPADEEGWNVLEHTTRLSGCFPLTMGR